MKEIYCVICGKHKKFGKPKISYFSKKCKFFLLLAVSVKIKVKKYLKKKSQLKY